MSGCVANGDGALALQRAARNKSEPGYISYQFSITTGPMEQSGTEHVLKGQVVDDSENRLTLLYTEVIEGDEAIQTVEHYLQRGEYQPTMYRGIDGAWTAQRVSRTYASNWLDSISFDLSANILKELKTPSVTEGDSIVNGVSCQRIAASYPADDVVDWLSRSLLPDFFGFQYSDSTLYDDVKDVSVNIFLGREDGRVHRLTFDLTPAIQPLVERSSSTHQENELWQNLRLSDCQLQIEFRDYDSPQSLVLPSAAQSVDPA